MKIEKLISPSASTLDELTELWERSVRSSHHFLTDNDIAFYKPLVHDLYLKSGISFLSDFPVPPYDVSILSDSQTCIFVQHTEYQ